MHLCTFHFQTLFQRVRDLLKIATALLIPSHLPLYFLIPASIVLITTISVAMDLDDSGMDWAPTTPPRPFDCYGQEYMPGGWPADAPTPTANVFARPADPGYFLPGAKKMCRGLAIAAKYTFDTALYTTTTISSSAYTGAVVATSYAVAKPTSRIVREVNLRRRSRKPSTPTRKLKSTTILSESPWLRAVAAREASFESPPTLALPQAPTTSSLLPAAPRLSAAAAHAAVPPFRPSIKAPERLEARRAATVGRAPTRNMQSRRPAPYRPASMRLRRPFPNLQPQYDQPASSSPVLPAQEVQEVQEVQEEPEQDSPSQQLLQDLQEDVVSQQHDSDVSSDLSDAWKPTAKPKHQKKYSVDNTGSPHRIGAAATPTQSKTAAISVFKPFQATVTSPSEEDAETLKTPPQPTTPMKQRFTPRIHLTATPESEISSTCDLTPGVTPSLYKKFTGKSPLKAPQTPVKKEETPVNAVETPVNAVEAPVNAVETPVNAVETPVNAVETPVNIDDSPAKGEKTTVVNEELIEPQKSVKAEKATSQTSDTGYKTPKKEKTPEPEPVQSPTPPHTPTAQIRRLSLDTPTPKAGSHSSERLANITRTQKKKAEADADARKYEIKPLNAEWDSKVEDAVKNGAARLKASDFARVVPGAGASGTDNWLNDEVIAAYLTLVAAHGKKQDRKTQSPSHHAFNSFFYTNLSTKGVDSVKKWAKKALIGGKSLLNTKSVFIPINSGAHWTLCVVSGETKTITHYNSLPGSSTRYLKCVREWVESELGSAFKGEEWVCLAGSSPQQSNSDDCGVFTITTARQLMLGMGAGSYSAADIGVQRRRIVAEIVNGGLLKAE